MTEQEIQEQNKLLTQWSNMVRNAMAQSASRFSSGKTESFITRGKRKGAEHPEGKLNESITRKVGKRDGIADMISFKFERHGVFVHKGVGRGYPIRGGGKINKPSGTTRKPVEWFNPLINQHLPELANRLAEINADAAVNATRLMIK